MKYYIVLNSAIVKIVKSESSEEKTSPRIDLNLLAKNLNAAFIEQKPCLIKPIDKINVMLWGTAKNWSFARSLASQLQPDDVVFCPGEGIGIPLAHICSSRKVRA